MSLGLGRFQHSCPLAGLSLSKDGDLNVLALSEKLSCSLATSLWSWLSRSSEHLMVYTPTCLSLACSGVWGGQSPSSRECMSASPASQQMRQGWRAGERAGWTYRLQKLYFCLECFALAFHLIFAVEIQLLFQSVWKENRSLSLILHLYNNLITYRVAGV